MAKRNPLHFRWDELTDDCPMPKLSRKRIIGEQAMISRVVLEQGCFVPRHEHANEQMAFVAEGALKFLIGPESAPEEVVVSAGEVLHLPSRLPHSAEAIVRTVVYDIFSPPSATTGIDVSKPATH